MTTARDLINYLQTIPEDTIIEVLVERQGNWGCYTEMVPMDLNEYFGNVDFFDFRKEVHSKCEDYGKCFYNLDRRGY